MKIVGNTHDGVERCQERNRTMLRLLAGGHDPNDMIRMAADAQTPLWFQADRLWWLPVMVRVTCELCPWSCLTTNNFWGEVHGSAHQLATHEGDPR